MEKEPQNGIEFEASLIQPITDYISVKDKQIKTLVETIDLLNERIENLRNIIDTQGNTIKVQDEHILLLKKQLK